MHISISKTLLLCTGLILMSQTVLAMDKDRYRPYGTNTPEIIQKTDSSTIKAIQSIVTELRGLPKGPITCSYDNGVISFQSDSVITDVSIYDREVIIGDRHYRQKPVLTYFNTLIKMVGDLSKVNSCIVRFKQFPTHDYKEKTVIDFGFGTEVIEVDALANGVHGNRREYTLDLIDKKKAYFKGI